jgi:hypothetical protein
MVEEVNAPIEMPESVLGLSSKKKKYKHTIHDYWLDSFD